MAGSLFALGGLAAATTFYMTQNNQKTVAEAGDGKTEVLIPFATDLKEGEMQVLKVGEANDQKVLVARY